MGYDVHRLVPNRPLVLGGIEIPHSMGLLGHSDADVVIHAICDALLGAAALRDIGFHFPDSDNQYKGIDSKILLRHVVGLIHQAGYQINNIDATICAERPKINPHIPTMISVLSECIGIPQSDINIKATTTEKLGFVGHEEGIAAHAVTLIEQLH